MTANTFGVIDGSTGSVRVTQVNSAGGGGITPGTGATDLGKAEDAPHASGDVGVEMLAVRADTPASTAANGDYVPLLEDGFGGLWSALESAGTPVSFAGITSIFRMLSAAGSTVAADAANVKVSAGFVYHIIGRNNRASSVFLKLYNKASAPTVGTDVPFATIEIPASTAFDFAFEQGLYFSTGIGVGFATAGADNSTAALTAADITAFNIFYT